MSRKIRIKVPKIEVPVLDPFVSALQNVHLADDVNVKQRIAVYIDAKKKTLTKNSHMISHMKPEFHI